MHMYIFCGLLIVCSLIALLFVVPPIWVSAPAKAIPLHLRFGLSLALMLFLPSLAGLIYYNLGAGQQLPAYYSYNQHEQRTNNRQVRPLYARLQRELIKNKLNIAADLANIDLILHVANLDSKSANGILQDDIKILLERVLMAAPQQITALNLLAVHSYRSAAYKQSVDYWEKILQQFTPEMLDSAASKVLQAKIAEARLFESKLTN